MSAFNRIAEQMIEAAIREGQFDNLPGTGKPINLEENPFEPEGWGMAFRLLKSNDLTLPWIALRAEIKQDYQRLIHSGLDRPAFEQGIASLNARILEYNLQAPGIAFQCAPLELEAEWLAAQNHTSSADSES